ncbi:hypothetical protein AA313_de0206674 [Arthrobotrys entomopaga]|nr:hypothetical protein AA313_de0206674 [Arthrobotrys entomopaga]
MTQTSVDQDAPAGSPASPFLANTDNTSPPHAAPGSSASSSTTSDVEFETTSLSSADEDVEENTPAQDEEKVGWLSLPKKKQLIILALCRLSEPISATSLLSYVYYFIGSLPDANTPQEISRKAGIMVACFSLCQFVTGMLWGRLSDIYGRKPIIVMGLFGSALASMGLGFSKTFHWAVFMRMMSGGSNATTGVLRTIVAELIKEKSMCMNIGIIIGPILGGLLANPIEAHPNLFGPGSWLGGKDGIGWMKEFPYALPNLVSASFLTFSFFLALFGLEETNPSGNIFGKVTSKLWSIWDYIHDKTTRLFRRRGQYQLLPQNEDDSDSHVQAEEPPTTPQSPPPTPRAVPIKEVLTPSVTLCLLSFIVLPLHNSTFMQLYPIFLSTTRRDNSHPPTPISWGGGLGLPAVQVGYGMAILGFIGITMQLFVYPTLQSRFGTLRSYRMSVLLFPIAYALTPFLAILPSTEQDIRKPAAGTTVWMGIIVVLLIQVTARTFAAPGNVILLINSVDNRRALGTVNGLGASLSSLARAVGPLSAGWGYGLALDKGIVGAVWWSLALVALFGVFVSGYLSEGKGFAQKEEEEEEIPKDMGIGADTEENGREVSRR